MMVQVVAPAPPEIPQIYVQSGGPPAVAWIIPIAALIVAAIILYPLMRALAKRIESKVSGGEQDELDELRSRVMALEEQSLRMPELEERVDFAERMLAKPDAARMPRQDG
jgi:hypothetical protein